MYSYLQDMYQPEKRACLPSHKPDKGPENCDASAADMSSDLNWMCTVHFHVHNEDELNLTPATAVIAGCFGDHGDSPPEIERKASIS